MISKADRRVLSAKGREEDTHNRQPLDLLGNDGKKSMAQNIEHSGLPVSDNFECLLRVFNQMLDEELSSSLDMTMGFVYRACVAG